MHVTHIRCPAYENLSLEQILSQLDKEDPVWQHLPDNKELRKVPKQWIVNVIATIKGDTFINWVSQRINERNAAVVKDRNLGIQMDPEVAAAFHNSTAVSL